MTARPADSRRSRRLLLTLGTVATLAAYLDFMSRVTQRLTTPYEVEGSLGWGWYDGTIFCYRFHENYERSVAVSAARIPCFFTIGRQYAPVGIHTGPVFHYHTGVWLTLTPVWCVAFAAAIPLVARVLLKGRPAPGVCRACGYDLRATPGRCPACGTEVATRPPHNQPLQRTGDAVD